MSALRGFGFTFENGVFRYWYVDSQGVKRWVSGDHPVDHCITPNPAGATPTREALDERKART